MKEKYRICPYCERYVPTDYNFSEHKKRCRLIYKPIKFQNPELKKGGEIERLNCKVKKQHDRIIQVNGFLHEANKEIERLEDKWLEEISKREYAEKENSIHKKMLDNIFKNDELMYCANCPHDMDCCTDCYSKWRKQAEQEEVQ